MKVFVLCLLSILFMDTISADSVSKFYLSGEYVDIDCQTSNIASIDLAVGTNCKNQSNVLHCNIAPNGGMTQTYRGIF